VPIFDPKIKRHSQEVEGENVGTSPPLKSIVKESVKIGKKSQFLASQNNLQGGRMKGKPVTKKISPKKGTRTPELKTLFEKIKLRRQMATVEKSIEKENSLEERKVETSIFKEGFSRGDGGIKGILPKIKDSAPTPQGDGQNVKKIIHRFEENIRENYQENFRTDLTNHSPSRKFQRGGKVNRLKKLKSPLVMKTTVSPVHKKKFADNISRKFSKLSKSTDDTSVEVGRNLMDRNYTKSTVQNSQRTIFDIWGPELSKIRPKCDD